MRLDVGHTSMHFANSTSDMGSPILLSWLISDDAVIIPVIGSAPSASNAASIWERIRVRNRGILTGESDLFKIPPAAGRRRRLACSLHRVEQALQR
jgi:hypothetical protein